MVVLLKRLGHIMSLCFFISCFLITSTSLYADPTDNAAQVSVPVIAAPPAVPPVPRAANVGATQANEQPKTDAQKAPLTAATNQQQNQSMPAAPSEPIIAAAKASTRAPQANMAAQPEEAPMAPDSATATTPTVESKPIASPTEPVTTAAQEAAAATESPAEVTPQPGTPALPSPRKINFEELNNQVAPEDFPEEAAAEEEKITEKYVDTLSPTDDLDDIAITPEEELAAKILEQEHPEKKTDQQKFKKATDRAEKKKSKKREPYFEIKQTEKLSDLVNRIAAKKHINIVFPMSETAFGSGVIKESVNFEYRHRVPLSQAEAYLHLLLQMAGYAMRPQDGYFVIAKTQDQTSRDPQQLYVDVPPEKLPRTSERIRAIYYLSNIRVPAAAGGNDSLSTILKDLIAPPNKVLFEPKSNGIIFFAPASVIASAMHLIKRLDESGSPDTIETIPLYNTDASTMKDLFDKFLPKINNFFSYQAPSKTFEDWYFAPGTQIFADTRSNSLVVIGQEMAINRIKDFVYNYLDVVPDTGNSVLHVYDLQYLDAATFQPTLQAIVTSQITGAQSEKEKKGGIKRVFDSVIVVAEKKGEIKIENPSGSSDSKTAVSGGVSLGEIGGTTYSIGGNRLIIAANSEDWLQVKSLIEQLDKPELQVVLEVLIVEVQSTTNKSLGVHHRMPSAVKPTTGMTDGITYQSAQLAAPVCSPDNTNPQIITGDLMRIQNSSTPISYFGTALTNTPDTAGGMIFSVTDPSTWFPDSSATGGGTTEKGIWAVLKMLDQWTVNKVLSHPFFVVKNNCTAFEARTECRRGAGAITDLKSAVIPTVPVVKYDADLQVRITPRIISLDRLSMKIGIAVNDFKDPVNQTDYTRTIRLIDTHATLDSGQVLVIGGLAQDTLIENESGWPFLSKVPLIGWLFKSHSKGKVRTNLVVFIHPTVVDPKLRAGLKRFAADKTNTTKDLITHGELFDSLKDPITRFFFRGGKHSSTTTIDEYFTRAYAKQIPDDDETVVTEYVHKKAPEKTTSSVAPTGPAVRKKASNQKSARSKTVAAAA